jgi:HlyD family secretion protein
MGKICIPTRAVMVAALLLAGIAVLAFIIPRVRGKAIPVRYVVVKKGPALQTVLANGRVAGSKVVALSFSRGGYIARVAVREGAMVRMGDTLVVLDNRDERNGISQRSNAVRVAQIQLEKLSSTDVAQATEQVRQARLREEQAKKQLDRLNVLRDNNAVSSADYENGVQQHDLAVSQHIMAQTSLKALESSQRQLLESQLQQTQNALVQAQTELSRTSIRAPEDGKVLEIKISAGETVSPASVVMSFLPADTTTHIELLVDENAVAPIRPGQRAIVRLAALPDRSFEATVRTILPVIDPSRGTATVQLAVKDSSDDFIPDQTVSAQIVIDTIANAIVIEQRYLRFDNTTAQVFVARNGKAVLLNNKVREAGDGAFIVEEGLAEGDTVLLAPELAAGNRIRLIDK